MTTASGSVARVVPDGSAMSFARIAAAGLKARDGDGDGGRDVGGLGLDGERVQHVLDQEAARGQVALGLHGDLDGDLLALLDEQQVDVDQVALDGVTLDGLRDRQLGLAVEVQGQQDVRRTQREQQVVARQGHVDRLGAVTVDDTGNLVLTADAAGGALAEAGTDVGGELDLGHVHSS